MQPGPWAAEGGWTKDTHSVRGKDSSGSWEPHRWQVRQADQSGLRANLGDRNACFERRRMDVGTARQVCRTRTLENKKGSLRLLPGHFLRGPVNHRRLGQVAKMHSFPRNCKPLRQNSAMTTPFSRDKNRQFLGGILYFTYIIIPCRKPE